MFSVTPTIAPSCVLVPIAVASMTSSLARSRGKNGSDPTVRRAMSIRPPIANLYDLGNAFLLESMFLRLSRDERLRDAVDIFCDRSPVHGVNGFVSHVNPILKLMTGSYASGDRVDCKNRRGRYLN